MIVKNNTLDTAFGLLNWGRWEKRQPTGSSFVRVCVKEQGTDNWKSIRILQNPYVKRCDHCYNLINVASSCGLINETLNTDGYLCADMIVSTALGQIANRKIDTKTKKLVIAFYQALVERLGVSRSIDGDDFDRTICKLIDEYNLDYERSPLSCIGYCSFCGFPDGFEGLLHYPNRTIAGSIDGKISDGKIFRDSVDAIISLLNRSPSHCNLMPPTPTAEKDGKLPTFGAGVFEGNFFSKNDVVVARGDKTELKNKTLPRFGAGNFGNHYTNSWLADFSMRKFNSVNGLDDIEQKNGVVAKLFREVVDALGDRSFFDKTDKDNLICTFASEKLRTDSGDPSGDFAACHCDYCVDSFLVERLEHDGVTSLRSCKHSGLAFGYASTILGAFGQNTARYTTCFNTLFKKTRVCGCLSVAFSPRWVLYNEWGCEITGEGNYGYNPILEGASYSFESSETGKYFSSHTFASCNIGVSASVRYSSTELPWIGEDWILYPYRHGDPDCRANKTLGIDDLDGYYLRIFSRLSSNGGYRGASYCFEWNDIDENGEVAICKRCDYVGNIFLKCYGKHRTNYPSLTVLRSKLIDLIQDINVVFVIRDISYRLFDCGVRDDHYTRGFHREVLDKEYLKCQVKGITMYNIDSYDLLREVLKTIFVKADAFVKGNIPIVSLGVNELFNHRERGATLPDTVIRPTKFPITRKDVFCGSEALVDGRTKDDYEDVLNRNIQSCGYLPKSFSFDDNGCLYSIWVEDVKSGVGRCLTNLRRTDFSCSQYSSIRTGFIVGHEQFTGHVGVCFGKWEPYALVHKHSISFGDAFGIVRWNYQMMKRQ